MDARQACVDLPDVPVLMWSAFDNPAFVARSVALGANGYILKSATRDELVKAIRTAAVGSTTWTRTEMRRVARSIATPRNASDVEAPLTQRETEVLKELAQGARNHEIARALGIGCETVKEHVGRDLSKNRHPQSHAGCDLGCAKVADLNLRANLHVSVDDESVVDNLFGFV